MKKRNRSYGWIFAKDGSIKRVMPPLNNIGKIMKKHTTVSYGALHDSVGFSRISTNNKHPIKGRR